MNAYVTATQANALSWQATVDASQGYPKAGVDVGAGIHVPPAQSITLTYFVPFEHPTLAEWAYLADAVSSPALVGASALPIPTLLDATWFPAPTALASQVAV
jgi:hypothetical protein